MKFLFKLCDITKVDDICDTVINQTTRLLGFVLRIEKDNEV